MRHGLPDEVVKRIAAVAYHDAGMKVKQAINSVSNVYNSLNDVNMQGKIINAHTTDAMNHRFKNKEQENSFKTYLAKSAAINRGTLDPVQPPA
jgi:hypothetical protein